MSCSLLLLPATKQSVWFHLFGVPWERALKYHRGLGALTYLFVTLHMVLWYLKWAIDSTLFHNMVSTHELKISPAWVHGDNPTVVTSELAWLALTLMIGVTVFGRRRSYELFYYLHVPIGLAFLGAALIHAWSFWYYGAIGLALFCGDALLRTVHAARAERGRPTFAEFDEASQVTTLRFNRAAFDHYEPGQYVHICVPAISRLERHPFTISSAPSAAERTLHIKAMPTTGAGAQTFTAKLARLVQSGGVVALGDVRIDGPLGSAGEMAYGEGFDELVLVAGGIGFTPIHSILAELLIRTTSCAASTQSRPSEDAAAADEESGGPVFSTETTDDLTVLHLTVLPRRVRVIWAARTLGELAIFAETLLAASKVPTITLKLFLTKPRKQRDDELCNEELAWLDGVCREGRPNLAELLGDLGANAAVFACGPVPLVDAASDAAYAQHAAFHAETFFL